MNAFCRWFLDLLFPPRCMLCHKLMEHSLDPTCGKCEHELKEYGSVARKVRFFEKTSVAFHYEGCLAEAIRRYKFKGMQSYCEQFAKWMAVRISAELSGKYEMISWVPCSRKRRWERGFDQCELLAKELSKLFQVPCVCTLKKVRDTPKQSHITDDAKRRANVLDAYQAINHELFFEKKILLIDDVLTTGATMAECGKTLRLAGSGDLVCAVIASAR